MYRQILVEYPSQWSHTDEFVYRSAGIVARQHPADLYKVLLGEPGRQALGFTYPPLAALLFAAASPFSFAVWQMALVIIDLILLPVIIYASLRIGGDRGPHRAAVALALAAASVWLEPVLMTLFFGQINLILLALIIGDLALPDSSRWKGVGIGVAAGLKLTPLVFIPYLLASRRVRAGLVSLLTFLATVALGFLVLPAASRQYWGGRFSAPGDAPGRLQNQSVYGTVLRLLPGNPAAHAVWLPAAIVVAAAGLAAAVFASRRGIELLGLLLCAVTGLLISPISWTHHWVWAVPGMAFMVAGAGRGGAQARGMAGSRRWERIARATGLAGILAVFVMWPANRGVVGNLTHQWLPYGWLRFTSSNMGSGFLWHTANFLLHNLYVVAGAAAIVLAAAYLWATRGNARLVPPPARTGGHLSSALRR